MVDSLQERESVSSPEINFDESKATIRYPSLQLDASNPTSPEVTITTTRKTIKLLEGKSYCNQAVLIDKETEKMKELSTQADSLRSIPENQRVKAVLDLLRSQVNYAYLDVIDALRQSNPELAQWVAQNTGLDSSSSEIPLSTIFEKGYGICRHLSVAYLWLAQKAGLEGTLMVSEPSTIKNIQRSDTGVKLFRSVDVDQPVAAHAWVEIKTSTGEWIPVDPSTLLTGETNEGLEMFTLANYIGVGGFGLDSSCNQAELRSQITGLNFRPGESTATTNANLLLWSTKPILRLFGESIPPSNTPFSGEGTMFIETTQDFGVMNLGITNIKPANPTLG